MHFSVTFAYILIAYGLIFITYKSTQFISFQYCASSVFVYTKTVFSLGNTSPNPFIITNCRVMAVIKLQIKNLLTPVRQSQCQQVIRPPIIHSISVILLCSEKNRILGQVIFLQQFSKRSAFSKPVLKSDLRYHSRH